MTSEQRAISRMYYANLKKTARRDNKETLLVKEEETNDAEVFGEVVVDVAGSQKTPSSSVLLLLSTAVLFYGDGGFGSIN